jgi:hypothetical protein
LIKLAMGAAGSEFGEPALAVTGGRPVTELVDDRADDPRPGDQAAVDALGEAFPVAGQGLAEPGHAAGDHRPVVGGRGGHVEEDVAHALRRAEQVGDRAQLLALLADRQQRFEPFLQQLGAPPVVGIGRGWCGGQFGQGRPHERHPCLVAAGRVVREPVLVWTQAQPGGDERI